MDNDTPILPGCEEAYMDKRVDHHESIPRYNASHFSGLLAEQAFLMECLKRGFNVLQPIGPFAQYDFVVDCDRLLKVQVKACTASLREGPSQRSLAKSAGSSDNKRKASYDQGDWDIVAYYIIPDDNWFLIPFQAIPSCDKINLSYTGKYVPYLDNWEWFTTAS